MDIQQVLKEAKKAIESCESQQQLQDVKVAYLGKKGKVTAEGYLRIWEEVELKNLAGTSYLDSINIELDPLSNSLFLSISGAEETISVDSFIRKNSLTNFDKQ